IVIPKCLGASVNGNSIFKQSKCKTLEKRKQFIKYLGTLLLLLATSILLNAQDKQKPLSIAEQGSFAVGGTIITEPGNFDLNNSLRPQGQTFHGDHAYAFYQIPVKARKYPLVFLHGAGQSKKTWETTPDGR